MNSQSKTKTSKQKVHFEWIPIQLCAENDSKAREKKILMNNCSSPSTISISQDENILYRFIDKFGYHKYFDVPEERPTDSESRKKLSKKKKGTNITEFRMKNEILFQDADFELFSLLDNYKMKYIYNFNFPICQYFYFLFWCVEILKGLKLKKKINPLVILDAILSINRFMSKEIITNHRYLVGFECIQSKMNTLVSSKGNHFFYNLLFANPQYLIESSFQSLDSEIALYKEQKDMIQDVLDSIDNDRALLYSNQHPTGQGKTFACAPLTNEISKRYGNTMCVIFACSNPLVRKQMAADIIIGESMHLWIGKHGIVVDKHGKSVNRYLIRPFKSCFPSSWKKNYKEDDDRKIGNIEKQWEYYVSSTKRIPNIIITDLPCCLEILNSSINKPGRLVAFIDEFITDLNDAKIMAKICTVLPKQSVLLSSVFPKFENIPNIVSNFCERFGCDPESSTKRVSSKNINIPVAIIDKKGNVHFPHHHIDDKETLLVLIESMMVDPRIRRCYPASYVYHWSQNIREDLPPELYFENQFQNIGQLNQNDACEYVILILQFLYENFHLFSKFKTYQPQKMSNMEIENIFTTDTHLFDTNGKTLCIFEDCSNSVHTLTKELFQGKMKIEHLAKQIDSEKKGLQKELQVMQKSSTKQHGKTLDKNYSKESISTLQEQISSLNITIPTNMILNHTDHFQRFHKNENDLPKTVSNRQPTMLVDEYFLNFSDDEIYQILSGIGVYDFDKQSRHQRELIMDIYHSFLFFCSTKKIIYGTNLPNISTIIIPACISPKLSINEIYQYIGRAGRRGVSQNADIILFDDTTLRIALSVDDTYEKNTDVENELIKLKK